MNTQEQINELKRRLKKLYHYQSAQNLLEWDQEVHMPEKGAVLRGEVLSEISSLTHETLLAINEDGLLKELHKQSKEAELDDDSRVIVQETWRMYERASKLPDEHIRKINKLSSEGMHVWKKAREENDFSQFQPYLEKMVDLKRKEAHLIGFEDSPYDALLDEYEPHMTSHEVDVIFANLKNVLIPFLKKITDNALSIDVRKSKGVFSLQKQAEFNEEIMNLIGFDSSAGYLATSTHPFTHSIGEPHDVRITTRYKEDNIFYSLMPTLHEAGHALYEQGLPEEHSGTPLAQFTSLGIHESQSRFWENQIGRSREFISFILPKLQETFAKPFKNLNEDYIYQLLNKVQPSLIRVEADEVTYNLHIVIRYELEKDLVEEKLAVKDLPNAWNKKYKEYLGVDVPTDTQGVLQDVHWSMGSIGYFPTYTLGNLYAAQFTSKLERDIPDLKEKVMQGEFREVLTWLRNNIHQHGRRYAAKELVERVSGEKPSAHFFTDYIEQKYSDLYNL